MRIKLAFLICCCVFLRVGHVSAQVGSLPGGPMPASVGGSAASPVSASGAASTSGQSAILVRDPRTGRLYKQELQTFDYPVTRWQRRTVERTVATPQTVLENQQVPQTTYVAQTEYVMQQKLKGWWNPLVQPTYAYEYVPVTRWVPQTQMVTQQVPTVKMISRTEQIAVDEPVQSTERVQRWVTTEVAATGSAYALSGAQPTAPAVALAGPAAYPGYAAADPLRQQPLIARVPILGQQRMMPMQPGTLFTNAASQLRPVARAPMSLLPGQSHYSAPLTVASRPTSGWSRDSNQVGLPATVIR